MSFFKTPMYRNRKLLDLAKHGEQCLMCNQYRPLSMAHSNQSRHGKSAGKKSSDAAIAMLCLECHDGLDNGSRWVKAERVERWNEAFIKTMIWLIENEYLIVNDRKL